MRYWLPRRVTRATRCSLVMGLRRAVVVVGHVMTHLFRSSRPSGIVHALTVPGDVIGPGGGAELRRERGCE